MGIENPRLALPGLNPHAGEEGLFGNEEKELLLPALKLIKDAGINCIGLLSPDTVFLRHRQGEFDVVIEPYHIRENGPYPCRFFLFLCPTPFVFGSDIGL